MSRVDTSVAANQTGEAAQINASRVQAAVRTSGGKAASLGISDSVEISSKAREIVSKSANSSKAPKVVQSAPSQKMRLVLATGTLLPPGKKTTVNIYG